MAIKRDHFTSWLDSQYNFNHTMTPQELRETITVTTGLTTRQVDEYFSVMSEIITEALSRGDRVELLKLGHVKIKNHQRWIENNVPAEIIFSPSNELNELIQLSLHESVSTGAIELIADEEKRTGDQRPASMDESSLPQVEQKSDSQDR